MVSMPLRLRICAVLGPTPHRLPASRGLRNSRSAPAFTMSTRRACNLGRYLGHGLGGASPDGHGQQRLPPHSLLQLPGGILRLLHGLHPAYVHVRLVQGQGLYQGRQVAEH